MMKIICIVGATGTGKNDLGLEIAKRFQGEIVNFDSRQVYRGFPIITAQPTDEEKKICPHHLYGFLEIDKKISAGEFADLAHKTIMNIYAKGSLPILVGGTGLYLKAILFGLAQIPKIPDEIRKKVVEEFNRVGSDIMYKRLLEIDPEYAKKIHPKDRQRLTRAIEVYEATKKTLSWFHNAYPNDTPKYNYLKFGIWMEKDVHERRLKKRIEKMIKMGGIEEVKKAWEKFSHINAPVWTSIGCREILDYIRGDLSFEDAISFWLKNTKKYAKRQITWFKKENDIKWLNNFSINDVLKQIESFLDEKAH